MPSCMAWRKPQNFRNEVAQNLRNSHPLHFDVFQQAESYCSQCVTWQFRHALLCRLKYSGSLP